MLMLGGKYCDAYLGDVQDALAKVSGVKTVDFKSMKGHAVVTVESEKGQAGTTGHSSQRREGRWLVLHRADHEVGALHRGSTQKAATTSRWIWVYAFPSLLHVVPLRLKSLS